jgi:hypothetical protein
MRWSLFAALAAFLIVSASPVRGGDDGVAGAWQQIESNAGACPKCRISIDQHGSSWTVTANNGWEATLVGGDSIGSMNAAGAGNWKPTLTGAMAGKRFNVDFVLKDQRLYMSMFVDMGNGSWRTIRGVFGRPWYGV